MAEANAALTRLRQNQVRYRVVLENQVGTLQGSRAPRDEVEPAKPSLPHAT